MTGQNRSSAVMQRRRVAPDSLDYFPTPPFATRALCEFLSRGAPSLPLDDMRVWEPACGELHMARPLAEYFREVRASDVHRYGDHELTDFLFFGGGDVRTDWIITNPPFKLADAFIKTALEIATGGIAMLLRGAFLEGQDRHATLFDRTPPDYVLQFVERVAMLEGRLVRVGQLDPFAEKPGTKVSTATSYCWFVWLGGGLHWRDTRLRWIAPCRHKLERPGDYPDYASPVTDECQSDLIDAIGATA
ncbi:hypothetical protein [Sphingobium sp.]|uniref:hypothetical protein n=1 Tax=Sphingobium sp. TaxID=1912891 RepID=UPI003BB78E5B